MVTDSSYIQFIAVFVTLGRLAPLIKSYYSVDLQSKVVVQ